MATSSLSYHLLYTHHLHSRHKSHQTPLFSSPISLKPNPNLYSRFCALPNSDKDHTPATHSSSSSSDQFSVPPLFRFGDAIKLDELGREMLSIAVPAALALAADPITSLVDTAFVGHLGSAELAAVGVSITVFNLISKLFNVPLLNITTSFVAEEQALILEQRKQSVQIDQDVPLVVRDREERKRILPSVSTSLILAAGLGLVEAVALSTGSGFLINIMGIAVDSPIRQPAEEFLTMRALGAPPIVMALAAQGTFRGFKDTRTPLYAVGAGNLLNLILDPVLIFFLGFGISGAAIATVISEYLIAFILLWKLYGEVSLTSAEIDGARLLQYLRSGGLLIGRTLSVLVPMTLATSLAAKGGPVPMAGHQICVEVWLTISLLTDALAIAGQALLAVNFSQGNYEEARQVVYRVLQIGFVMGSVLATILFLGFGLLSELFTSDAEVLKVACSGVLVVAALISSVFLLVIAPVFGLPGVWTGLFLFMSLRVVAGSWRLGTKSGPWMRVWSED